MTPQDVEDNRTKRIVTLCYRCRDNYEIAGYRLIFTGNHIKEPCDFCSSSFGLDYILEDRHNANKTMR